MKSINEKIKSIIGNRCEECDLLNILGDIKEERIPFDTDVIKYVADELKIPHARVEGVLTFYSFLGCEEEGKYIIRICKTISCVLQNKDKIIKLLEKETGTAMGTTSGDGQFTLKECNCLGMCDQGPALLVNNILLSPVKPEDIPPIIEACRKDRFELEYNHRYISKILKTGPLYNYLKENGSGFSNYIQTPPEEIIKKITAAGLRGRSGAGYPTGDKWRSAAASHAENKYIICNADEGEPGTFKDRFLLDKYPKRVIEGMITGARAIGAQKGILYLRGEYAYLEDKLIAAANIYDFDIDIHLGRGSYICGEETALIESLEGHRGEPRIKPPYPVEKGYKNSPSVVNNVETFVDVTIIMEKGEDFFKSLGTQKSTGTKFFSISGDCPGPGIYEVSFGITIKELIEQIGAEDIQSVQVGGAAGKNIGIDDMDSILAYEAVPSGGSIILFNKDRDMLKVAESFMDFFVNESCGQCVPCRMGTKKMLSGIQSMLKGEGSGEMLEDLMTLGRAVMTTSKCGLGQVSADAFITITENNKEEFLNRMKG